MTLLFAALLCASTSLHAQVAPPPGTPKGAQNDTPPTAKTGQDTTSASKPASAGEEAASTTKLKLGPLDPSKPPATLPKDRPVIGVALGGGGALAMSDIGALAWFEEHHIPVDVIAGTSMGSIIAALYSTGHTIKEMTNIMTDSSVNSVFRIQSSFSARNFRRREDSRDIPKIGALEQQFPDLFTAYTR